jgi:probable rRNA maturation factor
MKAMDVPLETAPTSLQLDIETEGNRSAALARLARPTGKPRRASAGASRPELANPRLSGQPAVSPDAEVQALNREWRGKDKPTNVLSFPMLERADLLACPPMARPNCSATSRWPHETCAREAAGKGRPAGTPRRAPDRPRAAAPGRARPRDRPEDAAAMEALEIKALALMGIADPYGDQDSNKGLAKDNGRKWPIGDPGRENRTVALAVASDPQRFFVAATAISRCARRSRKSSTSTRARRRRPRRRGRSFPLERQMLRNLLHFSEHDADDVAIPARRDHRAPASRQLGRGVAAFAEHGHSRMPVYGETLDEIGA